MKNKKNQIITIVSFLLIPLILLIIFTYWPAIKLFELSFSNWDGIQSKYNYVGFKNYIDVVKDPTMFRILLNTCAHIISMILELLFALYFAIILNGYIKRSNFFRSTFFMPYILNGVAVAFMFNYLYDFNEGPINLFLNYVGLGEYAIRWLGDNYFINFSLAFIDVWRYLGFYIVIFLAGLQSVPSALYEAATIDGANFFQQIRYITIPGIKRVIELCFFLGFSGAIQVWFQPFIITKGGPSGMSETFVTKTLKIAFDYQNFGKASAMGVLIMLIIIVVLLVQKRIMREAS